MTTLGPVELAYYAADLRTGLILEELPGLTPSGALGVRLGASTTANANLDLSEPPPGWEDATTPGKTMVVAVDQAVQQPVWAGFTLTREGGTDTSLALGLATPECYFDRRYTGDVTIAVATDQAAIMTSLGTALAVNAPCFVFDVVASGTTLDSYTVADGDDKTILSCWQEVMGQGGVEFTVVPRWADAARTTFQLAIVIRQQVGVQSTMPEVVFDSPGNVGSYKLNESYESGKGATDVLALGNGQGASRLKSADHQAADLLAAGWPSWVYRFTPQAGLDDPVQLDTHAAETLAQLSPGTNAWTIVGVASRSPRVGTDWTLGDSIRLHVTESPRHPNGTDVVERCYGWDLDPAADTITPILIEGG